MEYKVFDGYKKTIKGKCIDARCKGSYDVLKMVYSKDDDPVDVIVPPHFVSQLYMMRSLPPSVMEVTFDCYVEGDTLYVKGTLSKRVNRCTFEYNYTESNSYLRS